MQQHTNANQANQNSNKSDSIKLIRLQIKLWIHCSFFLSFFLSFTHGTIHICSRRIEKTMQTIL